jgi:hypothetical protein
MKLTRLLIAGGLAASLALPLAASAQQAPQPYGYPQQPYGAPQQPGPYQQAPGQRPNQTTPSAYRLQQQFARRFQDLNVTSQQQQQIGALIAQFSQSHPEGSPRDPLAMKQLRQQILAVLTPQQQNQYEQERAAMQVQRAQRRQQRLMQQQQQGQQAGQQPQYQQPQYQQPGQPQPQPPAAR